MRHGLVWLVTGSRYQSDPAYRAALDWVAAFVPCEAFADRGALALEHARARYAESVHLVDVVLARGADLLKTAGTLATIVAAVSAALGMAGGPCVAGAIICFLLAMAALVWSGRAVDVPIQPSIRGVIEGMADQAGVPAPDVWLAASYHAAAVGTDRVNRWRSAWLTVASGLVCLGVLFLLPAAVGAWVRASPC